ncbi:unnamed protein product, partial [Candidula unifasciata]
MSSRRLHVGSENDLIFSPKEGISKTRLLLLLAASLVVGFVAGILIGRYATQNEDHSPPEIPDVSLPLVRDADPTISKKILDAIDPARIEANLRYLSEKPHIAGRERDFELVKQLKKIFVDSGMYVQITPYDALLSYPSDDTPNSVRILDGNNTVVYDAKADESNFSNYEGVVPPFNAYSPNRLVEGSLVYAGYGRVEDYIWLAQNNINVSGSIVIVKYGSIFRGDK